MDVHNDKFTRKSYIVNGKIGYIKFNINTTDNWELYLAKCKAKNFNFKDLVKLTQDNISKINK